MSNLLNIIFFSFGPDAKWAYLFQRIFFFFGRNFNGIETDKKLLSQMGQFVLMDSEHIGINFIQMNLFV